MKPDAKLERKIVRMLGQFLADEQAALGRSRAVAWAWIISGSLLDRSRLRLCATRRRAMRQFIDAERVRQRSRELDAPVPK